MRASRDHRVSAGRRPSVVLWPVLLLTVVLLAAVAKSDEDHCRTGRDVPVPVPGPWSALAQHEDAQATSRCPAPSAPPRTPSTRS